MELNSICHEIINPLNIIVGYAELLKLEDLPNDAKKNINEIIKQSMWCYEVLDNEINKNKDDIINLETFIKTLISELEILPINKQNNKIIFSTITNTKLNKIINFNVKVHKVYLKIIIQNIVINSLKYSEANKPILIKLGKNNKFFIINISNNCNNCNILTKSNKLTSNNYGLSVIDNLIKKISGKWIFNQDNKLITTQVLIPCF